MDIVEQVVHELHILVADALHYLGTHKNVVKIRRTRNNRKNVLAVVYVHRADYLTELIDIFAVLRVELFNLGGLVRDTLFGIGYLRFDALYLGFFLRNFFFLCVELVVEQVYLILLRCELIEVIPLKRLAVRDIALSRRNLTVKLGDLRLVILYFLFKLLRSRRINDRTGVNSTYYTTGKAENRRESCRTQNF